MKSEKFNVLNRGTLQFWYHCCVLLVCIGLQCTHDFCVVVIFINNMVSVGSAPPKNHQRYGVPNPKMLSRLILDAISQAVVRQW